LSTYRDRQTELEQRAEIVRICRLLWERGYVVATDGNVSVRLGENRLLTTPSGESKGFLTPEQLVITDMTGRVILSHEAGRRELKPSSEILLHLEVYRQRPDVRAVVHAHPPITVACTVAGFSLARCVLPEVFVTLGRIPTSSYATPASPEGPEVIRDLIRDHDAIVLDRHGTLTVGATVWEAYLKLEKVEHAAQVTLAANQLGRVRTLTPEQLARLKEHREAFLRAQGRESCEGCTLCDIEPEGSGIDELVQRITSQVMRTLTQK